MTNLSSFGTDNLGSVALLYRLGSSARESMSEESLVMRRTISDRYLDREGREQVRGSREGFDTLPRRHIDAFESIPGFKEDTGAVEWMSWAYTYYERGDYDKAREYLTRSLNRIPAFEPYVFYYIRVCDRVVSVPLTGEEEKYVKKLERYRRLPKWLKWTMPGFAIRLRCKYCGRHVRYAS